MSTSPRVELLLVADEQDLIASFEKMAQERRYHYAVAQTGGDALEILSKNNVDVALLSFHLAGFSALQILEHMKKNHLDTESIVISEKANVETAVMAVKMGAYDYVTKSDGNLDRLVVTIEKALEKVRLIRRIHSLEQKGPQGDNFLDLIGRSQKMQEVYTLAENVAASSSSVLIMGESGTGKELMAKAIHQRSDRKEGPFVVINCAALPETLLESELFGYVKGAFTGATTDKEGLFEAAQGGTIFLDEIGEITPAMQVKLLRVLQDGELRRVGAKRVSYSNARVIAATNRDLLSLVQKKIFREDLYYRLNVITISLPALRERPEDIPLLAYHFLRQSVEHSDKEIGKISVDAMQSLQSYRWPGNVRELENVIERAVVLATGETITARELPPKILGEVFYLAENQEGQDLIALPYQDAKDKALLAFNRNYVMGLLRRSGGNLSLASNKAGMDRSNFKKIVKKSAINVKEFKKGLLE